MAPVTWLPSHPAVPAVHSPVSARAVGALSSLTPLPKTKVSSLGVVTTQSALSPKDVGVTEIDRAFATQSRRSRACFSNDLGVTGISIRSRVISDSIPGILLRRSRRRRSWWRWQWAGQHRRVEVVDAGRTAAPGRRRGALQAPVSRCAPHHLPSNRRLPAEPKNVARSLARHFALFAFVYGVSISSGSLLCWYQLTHACAWCACSARNNNAADWHNISKAVGNGRSRDACRHRWLQQECAGGTGAAGGVGPPGGIKDGQGGGIGLGGGAAQAAWEQQDGEHEKVQRLWA